MTEKDEGKLQEILYSDVAMELKRMRDADQTMRVRAMAREGCIFTDEEKALDERHTERMKEIVGQIGWPSISKVGKDGAQFAWLLVQHADHAPEFQVHCLHMMRELPEGDIKPWQIAYLEDRVNVNTGKPQRYGTQFWEDPPNGLVPRPIEDIEHLDERRRAIGLESFAEYKTLLHEKYKIKEDAKKH